jgi:hypothetical protein
VLPEQQQEPIAESEQVCNTTADAATTATFTVLLLLLLVMLIIRTLIKMYNKQKHIMKTLSEALLRFEKRV